MWKRSALGVMIALWAGLATAQEAGKPVGEGWLPLFDGRSLSGWKASEHPASFKVVDGQIVCEGPRAHLFYVGEGKAPEFRDFELKAEVLTKPGANSGIYFHTTFQAEGWPEKGFEIQVNNTHLGEGGYRELKKTGSLYGVRNQYKTLVRDNEWFTVRVVVRGKRVQVRVNEILLVDYVEPRPAVTAKGHEGCVLSQGTFALQCHDSQSRVCFRNILVKPLAEEPGLGSEERPLVDEAYRQCLDLGADNFPLVNLHVHLKGGLTLPEALEVSRKTGVNFGIAVNCGLGFAVTNDAGVEGFLKTMAGQPVFVGMQAEGREWVRLFSPEAIAKFDYVFTDAMTFTDEAGKRTRLWIKEEVEVRDKQVFMDTLVERILGILNREPIDIYVNPTFLPDCIAREYDTLWTPERMRRVVDAAVRNGVAIEINARYRLPSPAFIKMAKRAGAKFTFGTNNGDRVVGGLDYCFEMTRECGLTWQDMFLPKPEGQKPIQVRKKG